MAKKRTMKKGTQRTPKTTSRISKRPIRSSVSSTKRSNLSATKQLKAKLDAQRIVRPTRINQRTNTKAYLGNRIPLQKLATQNQSMYLPQKNSNKKIWIIAGIAVIAILILSLFLLFSDQLAGRAFYTGDLNTAGISTPTVAIGLSDNINLEIRSNIGTAETVSVMFQLALDPSLSCADVTSIVESSGLSTWETSSSLGTPLGSCTDTATGSVIDFDYTTFNPTNAQTGNFMVALISIAPQSPGTYNFNFNSFDVFSLDSTASVDLITNGISDPIVVQECTANAHCTADPLLPMCDNSGATPTYTCVALSCVTDTDCPGTNVCDTTSLTCRACDPTLGDSCTLTTTSTCRTDSDCSGGEVCDLSAAVAGVGTCVISFCDITNLIGCTTSGACTTAGGAWDPSLNTCLSPCDPLDPNACPAGRVCDSSTQLCVPTSSLPTTCGDGLFDSTVEQCDLSATPSYAAGLDCTDYDPASTFTGGVLSCDATCNFDVTQCTTTPPPTATELICDDGFDDDSDGPVDCEDLDCDGNAACQNLVGGDTCVTDSMCASGTCDLTTATCTAVTIPPTTCGNTVIDAGEECDGTNFGAATCASQTVAGATGSLSCDPVTCQIDVGACVAPPVIASSPTVNFGSTLSSESGAVIPQLTIYTTLYDANNVILAFKREVVRDVTNYDALISYNPTGTNYVAQREVLVQDAPASQAARNFARIIFDYTPDASGVLTESLDAVQTTEQGIILS